MRIRATKICGCCDVIMFFKDEYSARKAFKDLSTCATIIDDLDVEYNDIDTYRGFKLLN